VWCADQLEGFYVSAQAAQRLAPGLPPVPNLERGASERLKWVQLGPGWLVHQLVLRERGIVLHGPPPAQLVHPVAPDALRAAMRSMLADWGADLLRNPAQVASRGYQSYIVLSMCRMRYTLETGAVVSKKAALAWARPVLSPAGAGLLERAWQGRHESSGPPDPRDLVETLELVKETLRIAGVEFE
jgi:hypothetical protein